MSNVSMAHIDGSTLTVQRPYHIGDADRLATRVLDDRAHICHDLLEEGAELHTSLFVDVAGYALDTAATSQATDVRLRDTLDVVAQDASTACQVCRPE